MKKIIVLAMSALLAVSAVALPVTAQPVLNGQPRPVTAQELAQVRPEKHTTEEASVSGSISGQPVVEAELSKAAADIQVSASIPTPVLAHVTASTIILEKVDGYQYCATDGSWLTEGVSNVIKNLQPNTEYQCYLTRPGDPFTRGETITVTTKDRVPCPNTPKAPMVDYHTSNTIKLVERPGYEYRLADGQWQDSAKFTDLQPDTEYTFYQRIMQTNQEFASEESQPLVTKTSFEGPTCSSNMQLLRSYIDANGFVDEDGYKTLAYVMTDEYGTEYYFLMVLRKNDILFDVFSYSEAADMLAFNTEFPLSGNSSRVRIDFASFLYANYQCVDYAEDHLYVSLDEYHIGDPVTTNVSSDYMTTEDLSSLWTATTEMLFSFWDDTIYELLGFGFRGLGFVATEGNGDLACNPALQAHYGEIVLKNAHELECVVDGSEGDPYCMLCGQKVKDSIKTPCRHYHTYPSSCATDCNHCDLLRTVTHVYSFACDVKCDYCGLVRTDPLAAHTYGENGLCSKCGEEKPLVGDVSGDGKVNMGDVSKLYAYNKGFASLTEPAKQVADTTGDGKLNMGDVSRLYAHITGKKPL